MGLGQSLPEDDWVKGISASFVDDFEGKRRIITGEVLVGSHLVLALSQYGKGNSSPISMPMPKPIQYEGSPTEVDETERSPADTSDSDETDDTQSEDLSKAPENISLPPMMGGLEDMFQNIDMQGIMSNMLKGMQGNKRTSTKSEPTTESKTE